MPVHRIGIMHMSKAGPPLMDSKYYHLLLVASKLKQSWGQSFIALRPWGKAKCKVKFKASLHTENPWFNTGI